MCLTRFYSVFKVQRPCGLSLFAERKWRMRESNSRPPACKAGALPSELIPRVVRLLNSGFLRVWAERMGPSGLEPPTSRLSGARSNRLSYGPLGSFRFGYERRLSPYLSWDPAAGSALCFAKSPTVPGYLPGAGQALCFAKPPAASGHLAGAAYFPSGKISGTSWKALYKQKAFDALTF